ncbi:MAG: Beta-lactamase [uncultured Aureispira sp.]|uniref:Beta-lactamase n=1 Tax=uncultured Aureispira sp. TaxID=1331704 RepID=A0A6S6TXK9_9BACT|nr:MAG: Beta-lactamase [uncultured Aureispira sp.]
MTKYILQSIVFLSMICTLSSCTFTKIVVFFKPSIEDHEKVFVCDTIPGSAMDDWTSSSEARPLKKGLFINGNAPENIPAMEQWIPVEENLETIDFDAFLEKSKTTALIVIRNDSVLYERYLNGGAKDKPKVVFSVTKAIVATLTAIAAEEGSLSLDQKVADFIPEFKEGPRKNITLRHLMGMVSGLHWHDFDNLLRLGGLYYTGNQEKFVNRVAKTKYEPNTNFSYKSLSTQILGICLEKAVKQSLASYLEAKIWRPLGMQYEAMVTLDSKKHRNPRTFGGLALTAPDMVRFGKLMLDGGVWAGQQIVPKWFVEDVKHRDLNQWFGYSNCYWRNGYEELDFENNEQYWAAGYNGQYIFVSPKDNIIIVRTGVEEKNRWSVLLGRLSSLLANGRNDLTDKSLDFGPQFAGTYTNEQGQEMTLELLPELDKYERRQWLWKRDLTQFSDGKKLTELTQLDGISLGYKKGGKQTRMYYDVKEGKVQGFYYNSWPMVSLQYFKKAQL